MKLLIVGGVAGGASAAARARRLSESAEIILFERGPYVSFANCGLPYYIGGEITDRNKLLVATPERLQERFRIDVRTCSEVEAVDRTAKRVRVFDSNSNRRYEESYDKLILAPGAAPVRPQMPGAHLPGIFTLRNMQDMDRMRAAVDDGISTAIVVGAGFIGLEVAENLVRLGVHTTVVELQHQVLPPLDPEMTSAIVRELKERGVRLLLGTAVESFRQREQAIEAQLTSGDRLPLDLVLLAAGVRPESGLAVAAGLDVGPRGGIRVSPSMQTSDPDIYAVGDAVETIDFVTSEPTQVPLAGPANRQGRIAADNIFGRPSAYRGTQGTAIVRIFGRTAAITGASEKVLQRLLTPYQKIYVHAGHHAGYYPGAEPMTLKLLFAPDGKILGGQAVGGAGIDKRIDIIAMAIQGGMTVYDLEEAELAYAPQFGSAKDAVNMAGFVAANLLRGDHPQITVDQISHCVEREPTDALTLLDVRTPEEYAAGHIPGAQNVPIDSLRSRLMDLPREKSIVTYCEVGQRGYLATRLLNQSGLTARNLGGGYRTYRDFEALKAANTGSS